MPILVIDPKYHVEEVDGDLRIVKTSNGVPVPNEEPVILFRARDRLALGALRAYRDLCVEDGCTEYQLQRLDIMIERFEHFAAAQPKVMKQPGSTLGA